jgi:2-haloacid dehalogenase
LVKPDPAIYNLLLEKIGKPAGECIFIDDSPANIQRAEQMGFVTIHFTSPSQLEDELNQMGIL